MAKKRFISARRTRGPSAARKRLGTPSSRGALILFVLAGVLYANSISNDFVFDDHTLVDFNPQVNPASVGSIEQRPILYRPLRVQSYVLDRVLGGHRPASYRVGNIVYHAITGSIALMAYRQLGFSPAPALLAAAIFVAHPVQTESVAYISGRRDVLCGLMVLIAFILYVRWRSPVGRPWHAVVAAVAWLAGILTKEVAFALPLVVVAYDLTVSLARQRAAIGNGSLLSASRVVLRQQQLGYVVLGLLALGGVGYLVYRGIPTGQAWWGGTPVTNFLNVALLWVHSAVLMLFPVRLLADYSFEAVPLITTAASPLAWAAVVALLALLALSCLVIHRMPIAVFLLWWVPLTLLPSSHVLPHHDFFAEHYLYLPLFGFGGLLALAWWRIGPRLGLTRRHLQVVGLLLVLVYGVRTMVRNRDWSDNFTLWRVTSAAAPRCARARANYGGALLVGRDLDAAEAEFRAALAIRKKQLSALAGMVMIHHAKGRLDKRDRLLWWAQGNFPYANLVSLAGWFVINQEYPLAVELARVAARRRELPVRAWTVEGWAHARSGRAELACPLFEKAFRIMPSWPDARAGVDFCRKSRRGSGGSKDNPQRLR